MEWNLPPSTNLVSTSKATKVSDGRPYVLSDVKKKKKELLWKNNDVPSTRRPLERVHPGVVPYIAFACMLSCWVLSWGTANAEIKIQLGDNLELSYFQALSS